MPVAAFFGAGFDGALWAHAFADAAVVHLNKGDRVILRITAANRDPERFPCPADLDWVRHGTGHLSLGAGPHSCVGASLIRMAVVTITLLFT